MSRATPSGRLTNHGKQVLLDGRHLADARDEAAAVAIVAAIDFSGVAFTDIPSDAAASIWELLK